MSVLLLAKSLHDLRSLFRVQVNIDDCYSLKNRTADGDIVAGMFGPRLRVIFEFLTYEMSDPVRFSRGMKNLTDSIHALGFKTGIVSEKSNKFLVFC